MMNSCLLTVLLTSFVLVHATKLEDVNHFIDEVLSAIKASGLELYEMPNFSHNFQTRSTDGVATNRKVFYHSGNLTGLQTVTRKTCKEPTWSFGNTTSTCIVILPKVTVKYQARFTELTRHTDYRKVHKHEFDVVLEVLGTEASLELSASPHLKFATVKTFLLLDKGKSSVSFKTDADVSNELLSAGFTHKYQRLFNEVFYGDFKAAIQTAVENMPYPLKTWEKN